MITRQVAHRFREVEAEAWEPVTGWRYTLSEAAIGVLIFPTADNLA
jgi:hypothetical protein